MFTKGAAEAAAKELVERYGPQGALAHASERVERFSQAGDWPQHAAAAALLNAVERLASGGPDTGSGTEG